jgi:hypothetical protein
MSTNISQQLINLAIPAVEYLLHFQFLEQNIAPVSLHTSDGPVRRLQPSTTRRSDSGYSIFMV